MNTHKTSPLQQYKQLLKESLVSHDSAQNNAITLLEELYSQLTHASAKNEPIKGLYLWGKVGRGKTFLMDLFSTSLQPRYCLRQHFHHFMASIHTQLIEATGLADPLKVIALNLSKQYKVLCFDEFFVSDIGDAMLLGRLMQYLFEFNVVLVATSNIEPENLYFNGLQRSRFLPAIDAIKQHTCKVHLDGIHDHRERQLERKQIYFITAPVSMEQPESIKLLFKSYNLPPVEGLIEVVNKDYREGDSVAVTVLGREVRCLSYNEKSICFTFSQLCEGPRSHLDYIQLAKQFETVFLLNIPSLSGSAYEHIKARGTEDGSVGSGQTGEREVVHSSMDDAVRRFIALIDEFYERKVKLYLSSEIPLASLYIEGSLCFEFERAHSRLTEMASVDYYQLPHSP